MAEIHRSLRQPGNSSDPLAPDIVLVILASDLEAVLVIISLII
jgi:hypothetical protein